MTAIERIREHLEQAGATLASGRSSGPFADFTYQLGALIIQFVSEYGSWRANVGLSDGEMFPASFWLAALEGEETYPDPPVTDRDLPRLLGHLDELSQRAEGIASQVVAMGEQYSRAMRERLEQQ